MIDIGIPAALIEAEGIRDRVLTFDDAWRSGREALPPIRAIAGTCWWLPAHPVRKTSTGAFCCGGTAGAGAGLVTLAVPESLNSIMEVKLTEVMAEPIPGEVAGYFGTQS